MSGKVILLWKKIPGATSYNIYMSESPGVTKLSGSKIPNVTLRTFTITQLELGKTYYFVVTVVNGSGESKESKELSYTAVADKTRAYSLEKIFLTNQYKIKNPTPLKQDKKLKLHQREPKQRLRDHRWKMKR